MEAHPATAHQWSLGPILAETAVDQSTALLIVRPDVSAASGRDLERRLLGHRLSGATSIIVVVAGRDRLSGALISSLRRAQRRLGSRNGRLTVTAETDESRRVLECAGFEVIDLEEAGFARQPEGGPLRTMTETSR